jgi:hypothetical protein
VVLVQHRDDALARHGGAERGEVAQVAEEDRDLAALARRFAVAEALDAGRDLGRDVAAEPLATALLARGMRDEADRAARVVEADRRDAREYGTAQMMNWSPSGARRRASGCRSNCCRSRARAT